MGLTLMILSLIALALLVIYIASIWRFNYWKKQKVPFLKPTPIFGNYADFILMKKSMADVVDKICDKFPQEPYVGAFYGTEPTLIVKDPELIKLITTKDFAYFNGREVSKYVDREINTKNLFLAFGDKWKTTRQTMTPLFTSSKIRQMFPLIEKCAHMFENMLDYETSVSKVQEARVLMARYTMDCICSIGFGVDANTMGRNNHDNPFRKMGEMIFDNSLIRGFLLVTRAVWPAIFYGVGLKITPTRISDFFNKFLTSIFKERHYKPTNRHDFVDMVLSLKQTNKNSNLFDDEYLVAQCVVFFAAGYETSASTLSFTLFELAKNQEAQDRAIEEIDAYLLRHNNKIGYDCVTELPYIEACIDEAMRRYPVLGVITREVMDDYTLPSGVHLKKGVRVHMPVQHLHHNPEYFPEPQQYMPERFLPEHRQNVRPYTYMPFGEGARICIGMRVAKMQMIPGLVTVLKKYRVELADGMPETVAVDPRVFVAVTVGGIHLKLVLRDGWEQRTYSRGG